MAEFDTLPITPKPTTPRPCAVTPHGLGQGGEDEAGAASRQALGLLGARFSTGRVFRGGSASQGRQRESSPHGLDVFSRWLSSDSRQACPFVPRAFLTPLLPVRWLSERVLPVSLSS